MHSDIYSAKVVPSTEIIEATSSTIIIAVSVVVLVITVAICSPMRGSTAGHWWFSGSWLVVRIKTFTSLEKRI